jgi:N6-L-threonylcarbamoyladenine synthase
MRVLGIETTCDETAVAVVEEKLGGVGAEILSNEVMSQIARHAAYGGVVPEIAARAHIEVLDRLIGRALADARTEIARLDAIAAAGGPGLIGGVLVGLTAGKALALASKKPFIAVNHIEAHALTARLTEGLGFPYLALIASGGHTQIVAVRGVGDYERLGVTVDDAAGEAFDKVGKMLGLPYPGGPELEALARHGDPQRFDFPRPMIGRPDADFSFSGLKTAARQALMRLGDAPSEGDRRDLAASFQAAVVDVVVDRLRVALRIFGKAEERLQGLAIGGGVCANEALRQALSRLCGEAGLRLATPPPELCADNGAMIAFAGLERFKLGLVDELSFAPRPRWPLDAANRPPAHAGTFAGA